MDLLQLKYFSEVAKREHLNRTAEEMHVTPSAISASLSRLEKELGVKLFDRIGRNIRLNDYGKIMLKYTNQVFDSLTGAQMELQEAQHRHGTSLVVAITNPNLWNHSLRAFSAQHPEISISVIAFDTGAHPNSVCIPDPSIEDADFYIAAAGEPINPKYEFESQLLFHSRVLLAVPPFHRFANRTEIDLAEARDELFVNSPYNTSFRRFCDNLCLQAGFVPKSQVDCDYILRPRMLIRENMVCIATSTGKRSGLYDGTVMIPIVNPPCSRPQSLYWPAHTYQGQSARIFREFMVDYCSRLE